MPSSADKVYICNLALQFSSARNRIDDLSENTQEAKLCDLNYDQALEDSLEDGDFSWARKRAALSKVSTTTLPTGVQQTATIDSAWGFMYRLPSDCLRPLWLDDTLQIRSHWSRIPYQIELLDDLEVLYTDLDDAILVYAARVTNPALFSRKFAKVVAWKLAAIIALPLTGKQKLADRAEQMAEIALSDAIAHDYQRDQEPEPPDADWIEARGANPVVVTKLG